MDRSWLSGAAIFLAAAIVATSGCSNSTAPSSPAATLAFTTQPAGTTAGGAIGAVVTARDAQGNTATSFTGKVTLAITPSVGTTAAHLTGTTTVAAVSGVATFAGLSIDSARTSYT